MKNKAFTLIELLAVIVILAIIALIAIPIILNIIDDSKKSASMRGAELYLDTAEKSIVAYQLKNTDKKIEGKCDVLQDGNLQCGDTLIEVEMNGTKPVSGTITIQDGEIIKVESLVIGNDEFNTDSKGNLVISGATQKPVESTDTACFTYIDNYDYTINKDTCLSIYGSTFDEVLGAGTGELICSGNGEQIIGDFISLMNVYGMSKDQLVQQGVITLTNENPNGTITITGYNCGMSQSEVAAGNMIEGRTLDVIIPSTINGKTVTSIGALSFSSGSVSGPDETKKVLIQSVVIPNTVKNIEFNAFGSNHLKTLTIPNSVTSIKMGAFSYNGLTNLKLGNSVEYIGIEAFSHNQLTSIIMPDSVTSAGFGAFAYNQINSVTFSKNLRRIEEAMFENNQLKTLIIPNNIKIVDVYAFYENQLTSVIISDSVTNIGNYAFEHNQLTSVKINSPQSQVTLGVDPFGWAEGYSAANIEWAS